MGFFDTQFAIKPSDAIAFSESQRTAVEMQVCVSIAFEATWTYKNFKHPRFKNFYGYAQLMSGAFVVEDIPLSFLNQELVHWRDEVFGITDTTVCMAKLLATLLTPPKVIVGYSVKTRQRLTSIRFRLLPGIIANVSYVWETAQSNCDNEVREPDGKQGQPPIPDNSGSSGGARPGDQGGDPFDSSPNDGDYDPSSGLPPPPSPGGGGGSGTWKIPVTGYRMDDSAFAFTFDTLISDRNAQVSASTVGVPDSPLNDGGKSDSYLVVIVNGVANTTLASGWGLQYFNPYYY